MRESRTSEERSLVMEMAKGYVRVSTILSVKAQGEPKPL